MSKCRLQCGFWLVPSLTQPGCSFISLHLLFFRFWSNLLADCGHFVFHRRRLALLSHINEDATLFNNVQLQLAVQLQQHGFLLLNDSFFWRFCLFSYHWCRCEQILVILRFFHRLSIAGDRTFQSVCSFIDGDGADVCRSSKEGSMVFLFLGAGLFNGMSGRGFRVMSSWSSI